MRTGVVDGEKLVPEVEHGDAFAFDLDTFSRAFGNFRRFGDLDKLGHGDLFLRQGTYSPEEAPANLFVTEKSGRRKKELEFLARST